MTSNSLLNFTAGASPHSLWKTEDGGENWIEIKTTPKIKVLENERKELLGGVQFVDRSEGWLLEGSYLLHTKNAGESWVKQEFKDVVIRSFRFLDRNHGWFAGGRLRAAKDESEVETWRGVVYATSDGGTTWPNRSRLEVFGRYQLA